MNVWAEEKWADALQGKAEAYRKLGVYLAYLEAAAKMGDARAFYLLHHRFSRGREMIDNESYHQIVREYVQINDPEKKKHLQYYLKLGTKRQRKFISGQVPACRPEQDAAPREAKQKKEQDTVIVHR